MRTLKQYLRKYYEIQQDILLVSRPTEKSSWADRCYYLDDNYDEDKHYNHRSILIPEVVIEFDDDKKKNYDNALKVIERLKKDKITYMLWYSGGKSYHVHFLINTKKARNIRLLKKIIIRYYTNGLDDVPDLRLAVDGHLVRAEFGINEKTGKHKELLLKSSNYFRFNELPDEIWQEYSHKITTVIKRRVSKDLGELSECTCLKYIMNSTDFRNAQDGHERALFMLIHLLKNKYDKETLTQYLIDWYKYSGGYKLSNDQIRRKIIYHWNRNYHFGVNYIYDLLVSIGQESVLKQCPVHKNMI